MSDGITVYKHSERIDTWTQEFSEWNIDSMSGLNEPYPIISISRILSKSSMPCISTEFINVRKAEIGHIHPSTAELYYSIKGKIVLLVDLSNSQQLLTIKEGEFALLMPHVPHMVKHIEYDSERTYSHLCIQVLSKFHYPFYTTRRDYDFMS